MSYSGIPVPGGNGFTYTLQPIGVQYPAGSCPSGFTCEGQEQHPPMPQQPQQPQQPQFPQQQQFPDGYGQPQQFSGYNPYGGGGGYCMDPFCRRC